MKERRSLLEGISSAESLDRTVEESFVFTGKKAAGMMPMPTQLTTSEPREVKGQPGNSISRVPLTIRIRSDFAAALKRASLQRQLDGMVPNTLQDILEEALEPWLRANGYLN